jgi:hypothetical protein
MKGKPWKKKRNLKPIIIIFYIEYQIKNKNLHEIINYLFWSWYNILVAQ